MKKSKLKGLIVFFVFIVGAGYGQGEDPRVEGQFMDYTTVNMPESPSTTAFNAVGNVQVNTAKGVPIIRIPIYTYELDGVKVPIALSYDASGIKVGQMATSVGLGWSLEAGGQISRTVRSRPDEEEIRGWFEEGYIRADYYVGKDPNDKTWQQEMKGHSQSPNDLGLVKKSDHNPDLFSYSFLGHYGSYIHDTEMNIVKDRKDGIDIDPFGNFNDSLLADDYYGNKYLFAYEDTERSSNSNVFHVGNDLTLEIYEWEGQNGYDWITAWKLSEITTKNNKKILFKYKSVDMEYEQRNANFQVTVGSSCDNNPVMTDVKSVNGTHITYRYNTQLIKEIYSPQQNIKVKFEYVRENGLPNSVWPEKLDKIMVTDSTTGVKKEFRFSYGRFQGDPRLKLTGVYEVGFDSSGNPVEKPSYEFGYQAGDLPPKSSFAQDLYGYYNQALSNSSLVPQVTVPFFQSFLDDNSGNRTLNPNTLKRGVLTQIRYPTGGSSHFDYEPNVDNLYNYNGYRGGLRVKEIKDKDENNTVFNRKTYSYENLKGWDLEAGVYQWFSKQEGNTWSVHSSPVRLPGDLGSGYKTGYYYGKVKVFSHYKNGSYREEFEYEENTYNLQNFDYALKSQTTFIGSSEVKKVEYFNQLVASTNVVEWHVVGDMICFKPPGPSHGAMGYSTTPRMVEYSGNYAYLPTTVATTEFLENGSHRTPVTILKEINYDPETLLKTQEITDHRRVRTVDGSGTVTYPINDGNAPRVVVDYTYPFDGNFGFSPTFPKGIVVKQEETTTKNGQTLQTGGQAYAFDAIGNIKTIYAFNKGEGSNNSNLNYVPSHYEERTNFLFDNGKPVQVQQKQGAPTSYIWSKKDGLPLAKVEGIYRGAIDQNKRSAVENADYNGLPAALNALRSHPSVAGGMVTTFTHKPLCGVETITDAKGEKATYQYDPFGRLKTIRDNEGNILSETEYNFAQ